jgi:hypothetical protein
MFGHELYSLPLFRGSGFVVGINEDVGVEEAANQHLLSLVNLVAVEAPATGISLSGEALELFNAALGIIATSNCLQIIANELVEALAEGFCFLAGAVDELVVDGKSDIHIHSICGHVLCVNTPPSLPNPHSTSRFLLARFARVSE